MATSVLYAIARAKAIENKGLTAEKLNRLIECSSLGEMQKILLEMGYEGKDCFSMIENERERVFDFLTEVSPDEKITDCFLLKNEYHNIKVLVKTKYLHEEVNEKFLIKNALTDSSKLKELIFSDDYSNFSETLKTALETIDKKFASGERSSDIIDNILTTVMYKVILDMLKSPVYKKFREFFIEEIDVNNLLTALRVKNYGFNEQFFKKQFIEGGKLEESLFEKINENSLDMIYEELKYTDYAELSKYALEDIMNSGAFINFEREADNYFLNMLKKEKYDNTLFTFYGFIVGKFNEIKNVSIIATSLRSGVDKAQVKLRLRDLYV